MSGERITVRITADTPELADRVKRAWSEWRREVERERIWQLLWTIPQDERND